MSRLRRYAGRFLLSAFVGGLLLFLAFRDLDWQGMRAAFAEADYLWLLPFLGAMAGVEFFRAWRWRFLLEPIAPELPSTWRMLTVAWVGFAAIIALPLRLGEVVRPYLISDPRGREGPRLRMSAALGTIAVERVVDGLLVTFFLFAVFASLRWQGRGASWMMGLGWTALAVFGGALAFLVGALLWPKAAVRWALRLSLLDALARTGRPRLVWIRDKVRYVLEGLVAGFSAVREPRLLGAYVGVSFVYWVFNGLSFYFAARAFHLGLGPVEGLAVCSVVAMGITLPAGPGLVGNFHEFGRLGLSLYLPKQVVTGAGMAYIVLLHGLQLVWYVGIGALVLALGWVSFERVVEATQGEGDAAEKVERKPAAGALLEPSEGES